MISIKTPEIPVNVSSFPRRFVKLSQKCLPLWKIYLYFEHNYIAAHRINDEFSRIEIKYFNTFPRMEKISSACVNWQFQ